MKILIVDDDAGLRKSVSLILLDAGYEVLTASDGEEGLATALIERPDLILCDVRMPKLDGLGFLDRHREAGIEGLVLMTTAYGSTDLAIQAMKRGAYDYLPKPFGADEVLLTIRKAEERESLRREVSRLRSEVRADARFGEIIARSPVMVRALELATKVARHDASVFIMGPSGTGKELVARLIHREGERADRPFVAVNCGAIPETLLEAEFFGVMKGSFTGADRDRAGLFEAADGGTLFLDEVGELPVQLQVKLLRVLQDGEMRRIGGTETTTVDVRVVCATNRDIKEAIQEERFREDLYYRLAVVTISLPPLTERTEEIPDLAHHLLERHVQKLGVRVEGIEPSAMEVLLAYPWPGNVRELENVIERALVLADGPHLTVADLPEVVRSPAPDGSARGFRDDDLSVKRQTAELESFLIQRALERTGGNRTEAAQLLELSPRALRYKINDYGLR